MKKLFIVIICISAALFGCEAKSTKEANLNGQTVTDIKGNKWLLKHNIGDNYFLYQVIDGHVNFNE